MSSHPADSQRNAWPEFRALYASDCQSCGVCCVYHCESTFHIPITTDLEVKPKRKLIQIGPRVADRTEYMRIKPLKIWPSHNCCIALEGTPRKAASCSTYETRPRACSSYDPGSLACLTAREWASMPMLEDGYGRS